MGAEYWNMTSPRQNLFFVLCNIYDPSPTVLKLSSESCVTLFGIVPGRKLDPYSKGIHHFPARTVFCDVSSVVEKLRVTNGFYLPEGAAK
jgi:hypothetical protein